MARGGAGILRSLDGERLIRTPPNDSYGRHAPAETEQVLALRTCRSGTVDDDGFP